MARAVFYARVSKKDKSGLSGSIHSQFKIIENFWEKVCDRESEPLFLSDEGYSGRNPMRPAFRRLLGLVALGEVNILIVKDFSRLSRDYILFGFLCREVFVRYKVRFLSVMENYDSFNYSSEGFGMDVRSVFNEYYCHDISRKVKMTFDVKKENGDYSCRKPPFGYKWNDGKTGWEIVDSEAVVVREIFEKYYEGKTLKSIGVEIQERYGEYHHKRKSNWEPAAVWRILHNPAYIGYQVWHKYETLVNPYGKKSAVPRLQWELRRGTHEAIINKKDWEELILQNERATDSKEGNKGKRHIFHGLTKCGGCGRALSCGRHNKQMLCCNHCSGHEEKRIDIGRLFEACMSEFYKLYKQNKTRRQKLIEACGDSHGTHMQELETYQQMCVCFMKEPELFLHHFIHRIEVCQNGVVNIYWAFRDS